MARASKVLPCMICDEVPCSCFKKSTKSTKVTKIATAPRSGADSVPVPSPPAPDITPAQVKPAAPHDDEGRLVPHPQADSLELARALRVLAPILHPDEIERHRIGTPPRVKAEQWRRRNNESSGRSTQTGASEHTEESDT